ncbi:MAG: class I SAM-dependent RNA methyltransferase [Acidobacteria bacterium]|nr:class I SAM-dependent RNA methyltransferase [Acidobacteriota bacterium]
MLGQGSEFTATIDKPVAGGRMLARHEGQVVLVSGVIPGEQVRARVTAVGRGVAYAAPLEIIEPHAGRRMPLETETWLYGPCGGNVYQHIDYELQLSLKKSIVLDAFARIGRLEVSGLATQIVGSPEQGYRMRARLHLRRGRLGFFREGTHRLCDYASTGQLLPRSCEVVAGVQAAVGARGSNLEGEIELTENVPASERVLHCSLNRKLSLRELQAVTAVEGLTGLTASVAGVRGAGVVVGNPHVHDDIVVDGTETVRLRRHVRSFFQGNRFLLNRLVAEVVGCVPDGPVIDLYAGVGLFGVPLAAAGRGPVEAVEVGAFGVQDLRHNVAGIDRTRRGGLRTAPPSYAAGIEIVAGTVEDYLARPAAFPNPTVIADPPRTGLSKAAVAGVVALRPRRIVYVSCDVATLARDARLLAAEGYAIKEVLGFDLFPNTGHVEMLAVLDGSSG